MYTYNKNQQNITETKYMEEKQGRPMRPENFLSLKTKKKCYKTSKQQNNKTKIREDDKPKDFSIIEHFEIWGFENDPIGL